MVTLWGWEEKERKRGKQNVNIKAHAYQCMVTFVTSIFPISFLKQEKKTKIFC